MFGRSNTPLHSDYSSARRRNVIAIGRDRRKQWELFYPSAVFPHPDEAIQPVTAFSLREASGTDGASIPYVIVTVQRDKLLRAFLSLTELLGPTIAVTVTSSHDSWDCRDMSGVPTTYHCEEKDGCVLAAELADIGDTVVNDGHLAIEASQGDQRVLLTDHKELIVEGEILAEAKRQLRQEGISEYPDLQSIRSVRHSHNLAGYFRKQLQVVLMTLGCDGGDDEWSTECGDLVTE